MLVSSVFNFEDEESNLISTKHCTPHTHKNITKKLTLEATKLFSNIPMSEDLREASIAF